MLVYKKFVNCFLIVFLMKIFNKLFFTKIFIKFFKILLFLISSKNKTIIYYKIIMRLLKSGDLFHRYR